MTSLNQLIRLKKRQKKKKRTKVLSLQGCPQKKGVCVEIRNNTSPKKPNSARRKVAKVKLLSTGKHVIASIPGQGHNLQKFSLVLVRGGRAKDLPGVRYKLIKGKYDFSQSENIIRKNGRSKYGMPKIKL
jgi:small subunit ribosomal protein S12